MKKTIFSTLLITSIYSNEFSVNSSYQGFSGIINTPNAQITKEGHATLHFNNQFDNNLRAYNYEKDYLFQEDYIVGFGLFSFMEVQGRLSESKGYHRDLSANFKIQLPYHHKYLPDIAVGIQDLGGAANNYDNQYIVIDKEIYFVRTSVGYGHATVENENKKRMNGLFGAVEIKAQTWLYLMAENDAKENHVALRLVVPPSWISAFNVNTVISQNLTNSATSVGFTVDIPLYHSSRKIKESKNLSTLKKKKIILNNHPLIEKSKTKAKSNKKLNNHQLRLLLEKKLIDFGFENISMHIDNKHLYLKLENSIFDHTDLDALGYIIGTITDLNNSFTSYTLTLLKNNLKTIIISGKVENFKNYLNNPSQVNENNLKNNLIIQRNFDDSKISYSKKVNSSNFIPRVELSLGLITAVGTEVGAFDYVSSLKINTYMNVYDGLVLSVLYDFPFAHSNSFNQGEVYYNVYKERLENRFVNIMAHQTLQYENILNTTSFGQYNVNYIGIMNQTNYTSTDGTHGVNLKAGIFSNNIDSEESDKVFALAKYRYLFSPLDLYLEATYGEFWYGDVGADLRFKRFFGETSVEFFYKNSSIDNIGEQFAGIKVEFPFTTRKLYKANYLQIKGKKDFNYSLHSTILKEDGTNRLNHNYGITPPSDFEITTHYLDRDRLNSSYIKNHLDRLRDAYIVYSKD